MSDDESIREDARRDAWYEANVTICPECGGDFVLIEHFTATPVDPECSARRCDDCQWEAEG